MSGIEPETSFFAYTSVYCIYYRRARLYLFARGEPLSVVRAFDATVLPLERVLTVIRDSCACRHAHGQGLRPTKNVLYQLSYIGTTNFNPLQISLFNQYYQCVYILILLVWNY